MRVLVVDDDPVMLRVTAMALELAGGFEVVQASDGEGALERTRQVHPDVILLDLFMHDLDGREVLARLRADAATAAIPVILRTASPERVSVRDLIALGAKGIIVKPFDPSELGREIRRILSQ